MTVYGGATGAPALQRSTPRSLGTTPTLYLVAPTGDHRHLDAHKPNSTRDVPGVPELEGSDIAVDGSIVYLATFGWNGRRGIRALDVSNPASIQEIATITATSLKEVRAHHVGVPLQRRRAKRIADQELRVEHYR